MNTKLNINTREYWNNRFLSNDWSIKGGEEQTTNFALEQVKHFSISKDFNGTILDFGCAIGNAIPVYKSNYPNAKLFGLDISENAIEKCKEKYGDIATFIAGTHHEIPHVDIIIASNVFEHLSNDKEIAKELLKKCNVLYIVVPYKELLSEDGEHINTYNESYFKEIGNYSYKIFKSYGWSHYGKDLVINVYLKNILRFLLRRKLASEKKQIMYCFRIL